MTSKPEKFGMSEGQKLAVFSIIGAIAGVVLVAFYLDLDMWGRVGMVFGGLGGFIVGFIYLFIRNLKGIKIPKP
jgi:hypothetical protein